MSTVIEILPDHLMDTREVAKALKSDTRTVQKLGQQQILKATLEKRPRGGVQWMFDPQSVREYLQNPAKLRPKAPESKALATHSAAVALRTQKPSQGERALDTVSIVGQMLAAQKVERELLAKNYEALLDKYASHSERVLELLFANQRADREDARQRWELDRQERLERKKKTPAPAPEPEPAATGKPNGKAKGARA